MIDKPGKALDEKIAEALGMEIYTDITHFPTGISFPCVVWDSDSREHFIYSDENSDDEWKPSTSWASMKLVVEEMHSRGMGLTLQSFLQNGKPFYEATFGYDVGAFPGAESDDAPHAVALAALKALEDSQSC